MRVFSFNSTNEYIKGILLVLLVTQCASLPLDDELTYDVSDVELASNSTTEAPSNSSASTRPTMLPETTTAKPGTGTEATSGASTAVTAAPTAPPPTPPSRGFDVGSFFGGIVLGVGLLVLGYFAYTFYKRRTAHNYQQM